MKGETCVYTYQRLAEVTRINAIFDDHFYFSHLLLPVSGGNPYFPRISWNNTAHDSLTSIQGSVPVFTNRNRSGILNGT